MVNRVIVIMAILFVSPILCAQSKINLDNNCLTQNAAILSQTLIELKGENFVSNLLNNKISFSIICVVDSLGTIMSLEKIRSRNVLSKEFEDDLSSYLKINSISFNICYEKLPGITNEHTRDLIKETTHLININFPGYLMDLYQYERDKAREEGLYLSKYEYLISMINKHKPQ